MVIGASPNGEAVSPAPHPRSTAGRSEETLSENLCILNVASAILEDIHDPRVCSSLALNALAPLARLDPPQASNCCLPVAELVG